MNPGWRSNYLRYKSYFLNVVGRYKERADIMAYMEILLSLTTISLFSIFALRPTLLTIGGLTREIDSKQAVLDKMSSKIRNLSQAQSLYDRQRAKIVLLNSAIPTDPQPDTFMRQILGVSTQTNVEVLDITTNEVSLYPLKATTTSTSKKVKQASPSGQLNQSELSISVQTKSALENYSDISTFLTQIENLRRPLNFEKVSLSVATEREQKYLVFGISGSLPYLIR